MNISFQHPRRLNLLRLRLHLLHVPIRTHILPSQEPSLLTSQPKQEIRR